MLLKKAALIIVFQFFIVPFTFSQEKGLSVINKEDLKRHLTFISSDSIQGRTFGTEVDGLGITAEYLKLNAEKIGLKPGAENYFQPVNVVSSEPDWDNTFVEIADNNGNVVYHSDSVIGLFRGGELDELKGKLVFAGFGLHDEKSGYNDFGKIDLKGKIVVYSAGSPESFKKREIFQWNNQMETSKMKTAISVGALGVIVVNSPLDENNNMYSRINRWMNGKGYRLGEHDKLIANNFVLTTSSFADVLLGEKGRFKKLLSKIAKKSKPNSFLIEGFAVNVRVKRKTQRINTKNVIGIVEGSDPKLKNECVVFMAHYDHLGVDESGEVYNGADDNGSGTVTLMEVAKAFISLKQKPKRSIVFLWVTAEEVGMLGSQYYSKNPVFPMEKTVACINIDMDGRVFEPRDTVWNKSAKKVKDFDGLYTLSNDIWPELKDINSSACKTLGLIPDYSLPSNFLRSSDHYHFHNNGVPILNYATGYHADYHKVGDEVSKINFDKMKRVADLCFLVGYEIANLDTIERKE